MQDKILLSHGGGGEEMAKLIRETIFEIFSNEILRADNDSALLGRFDGELAFSTDSFVVTPLFFPGGDIGKIAVCGTVNDLAMVGAKPLFISCALIIEEGLEISELKRILTSLAATARASGVQIVCGDTKVVPRGKCDKIFINTSGVGRVMSKAHIGAIKPGAKVLISGDVGRHGAVVLAARDELVLSSELQSDCKPLAKVVEALVNAGVKPLAMRDATRGGLSAVLNEFALASSCDFIIKEDTVAVSDEVTGVCELLGFEPFELANEGTFVLIAEENESEKALEILRNFDGNAGIIGDVSEAKSDFSAQKCGRVVLKNAYGASRFLELPKGELLPRIC